MHEVVHIPHATQGREGAYPTESNLSYLGSAFPLRVYYSFSPPRKSRRWPRLRLASCAEFMATLLALANVGEFDEFYTLNKPEEQKLSFTAARALLRHQR